MSCRVLRCVCCSSRRLLSGLASSHLSSTSSKVASTQGKRSLGSQNNNAIDDAANPRSTPSQARFCRAVSPAFSSCSCSCSSSSSFCSSLLPLQCVHKPWTAPRHAGGIPRSPPPFPFPASRCCFVQPVVGPSSRSGWAVPDLQGSRRRLDHPCTFRHPRPPSF